MVRNIKTSADRNYHIVMFIYMLLMLTYLNQQKTVSRYKETGGEQFFMLCKINASVFQAAAM